MDFHEWLMEDERQETEGLLEGVKFSVFALGNSTYDKYNETGHQVDRVL